MNHKQTVTIIDVAESEPKSRHGTVSNVLTGKRPVAEHTRKRIQAAIDELGYQPNLLARSLVNRASNSLGVVASGLELYGPSRTLAGIERQANELGYSLLLNLLHDPETAEVDSVLDDLLARRVDGIIWAVHEMGTTAPGSCRCGCAPCRRSSSSRWSPGRMRQSFPPIIVPARRWRYVTC